MIDKLISELTGSLNLDKSQAQGGVSVLLDVAKNALGGEQFNGLVDKLGAADLAGKASSGGGGGILDSALSMLGGSGGTLGAAAKIFSGFKDLGIDMGDVQKFIPMVLNFVGENVDKDLQNSLMNFLPDEVQSK